MSLEEFPQQVLILHEMRARSLYVVTFLDDAYHLLKKTNRELQKGAFIACNKRLFVLLIFLKKDLFIKSIACTHLGAEVFIVQLHFTSPKQQNVDAAFAPLATGIDGLVGHLEQNDTVLD